MATTEIQAPQEDDDRLGRFAIQALAILGGLAGLLIAAFQISASFIGASSVHIPRGWSELGLIGGVVFLLLGLAGLGGAFLYTRNKKGAAWLLLACGLLGFPVGYISWMASVGFLGWVLWTPAGVLLTVAGLLALVTPERLRVLLGQGSNTEYPRDRENRGSLDKALFLGVVFLGIGVLTVVFMLSGLLLFGAEDSIKGDAGRDQDDFDNADIAASMGRWDKAVESYDDILSRNQSNARAWEKRAFALDKMGRYQEANESHERAQKLKALE